MPKTLLAVDDSATMRKVLEITFGGDDFQVVTADSRDKALAQLGGKPAAVLIDAGLDGDGYALSKDVRQRDGATVIILLSSRHNPYDAAKGKDAGADDFMDKPFDTAQAIEKVKKAIAARASGGGATASAPATQATATAPAPAPAAPPVVHAPPPAAHAPPPAAAAKPAFGVPATAAPVKSRSATLMFGGEVAPPPPPRAATPAAPPAAAIPGGQPAAAKPAGYARPAPEMVATTPSAGGHVAAAVNGQLGAKLGELGLSKDQIDAVLALSRDVVEKVVWEVVPQLAEVLIKEEIARLTKE